MQGAEEKGTGVGVEAHRTRDVVGGIGLSCTAGNLDALAHQLGERGAVVAHAIHAHTTEEKHTNPTALYFGR